MSSGSRAQDYRAPLQQGLKANIEEVQAQDGEMQKKGHTPDKDVKQCDITS